MIISGFQLMNTLRRTYQTERAKRENVIFVPKRKRIKAPECWSTHGVGELELKWGKPTWHLLPRLNSFLPCFKQRIKPNCFADLSHLSFRVHCEASCSLNVRFGCGGERRERERKRESRDCREKSKKSKKKRNALLMIRFNHNTCDY